jgi:hypothetical protein
VHCCVQDRAEGGLADYGHVTMFSIGARMVKSYVYNCTTYSNIGDCNNVQVMGEGEGGGLVE